MRGSRALGAGGLRNDRLVVVYVTTATATAATDPVEGGPVEVEKGAGAEDEEEDGDADGDANGDVGGLAT